MSQIIIRPVSNEKAIKMMETENKLMFVCLRQATKAQIKEAIETMYGTKIDAVRTHITRDGNKRAIVTFNKAHPAIDVATNLGLL